LAVARILDLDPVTRWLLRDGVRGILPLADDTFQVHLDDLLEEQPPVAYHVIEIKDA